MDEIRKTGRVTIPTDLDVVPETLEILKKWGADAIRDCDGTDFPQQLKDADAKIYSTYYTTRKDNAWAKANPDEVLKNVSRSAVDTGLKYVNNDACYPSLIVVGQIGRAHV